ncbi:MAG: RNA polymerase sigma factor [Oscillospiraceae bacterium]
MDEKQFDYCILLIRQGRSDGLRAIYESYFKVIYSIMLSVTKNPTDAEDLTSDFFVKLWDKLAEAYRSGSGHKSWLAAAARNMAVDFLRRKSRVELTLDDEENPLEPQSAERLEETVIGSLNVQQALDSLKESEREIVSLKLFAELTFKEIAAAMKMPMGTVTWKYNSAMKKLKEYFKEVRSG